MDFKTYINNNKEELINVLKTLVSYNTVENKSEKYIFGNQNKLCLDKYLEIAKSYGFNTKNLDDYCGYAEYGDGKDIIGVVGHLDIVAAGNNWNTDPFVLTENNGFLYGRGTSDDKGAVAASLIALKIIKDLKIKTNNKIRLIVGCNEETSCLCMKHYIKEEGPFKLGFTPDADFPCINGEKGIIHASFKSFTNIPDISGGLSVNAVADTCNIKVLNNSFNIDIFKNYLDNNKLTYEINKNGNILDIKVHGKSSHASLPDRGINAITHTMYALNKSGYTDTFIDNYVNLFDIENSGKNIDINLSDKYSMLTMVNGTIRKEKDYVIGSIDIRVPITIDNKIIMDKLINNKNMEIKIEKEEKALYFKEDHKLVKSLMKAYQKVTKDNISKPKVIGGGTYAKSLENCIAFGCEFSSDNNIHDANERVSIKELLLQVELYINAILELDK